MYTRQRHRLTFPDQNYHLHHNNASHNTAHHHPRFHTCNHSIPIHLIQESHSQRTFYAETQRISPTRFQLHFYKISPARDPPRLRLYRLRTLQPTHSSSRPPRDLSLRLAGPPQYFYNKDTVSSSPPPSSRPHYHQRAEEVKEAR